MDSKSFLVAVCFIILMVSVVHVSVTYLKINDFREKVIGFALNTAGSLNITVLSSIDINFTSRNINWGPGSVNVSGGYLNATLITRRNNTAEVSGGNWSVTNISGLLIENVGNVNVSLNLSSSKNATDLFAGTSNTNQAFEWNITNGAPGSCSGGTILLNTFIKVNKSVSDVACAQLGAVASKNKVFIDILLAVPYDFDTSKINVEQSATITATAVVA
ncbi:hypothetical protein GOV14_04410 [Candidatus Pacearchaeota archaeon]|nr:hypothetical protein [Candidatus Pacearchaeota archaeon]